METAQVNTQQTKGKGPTLLTKLATSKGVFLQGPNGFKVEINTTDTTYKEDPVTYLKEKAQTLSAQLYDMQQELLNIGYRSMLDALDLPGYNGFNELLQRTTVLRFKSKYDELLEGYTSEHDVSMKVRLFLANALLCECTITDIQWVTTLLDETGVAGTSEETATHVSPQLPFTSFK